MENLQLTDGLGVKRLALLLPVKVAKVKGDKFTLSPKPPQFQAGAVPISPLDLLLREQRAFG